MFSVTHRLYTKKGTLCVFCDYGGNYYPLLATGLYVYHCLVPETEPVVSLCLYLATHAHICFNYTVLRNLSVILLALVIMNLM